MVGLGYEFHDDVLLGLDLQHLQHEANEWSYLDAGTVNSTDVTQLHGFVHEQFWRQSKAFLLPEFGLQNSGPDDFLDQELWIRSFNPIGILDGAIGHFYYSEIIKLPRPWWTDVMLL